MNYFRLIKWIALALLIMSVISLGYGLRYYKDQAEQNAIGRDEAIRIANDKQQETDFYKNKLGDTIRITKVAELNIENFKALTKSKELEWINKFEGLKKNKSNLASASEVNTEFDISRLLSKGIVKAGDTIKYITSEAPLFTGSIDHKVFRYLYKDEWNDIDALVIDTPKLILRDKIYFVMEWKRRHKFIFKNWRFGNKEWFQEVTNSNKLISIDSQSVFIIRRKD